MAVRMYSTAGFLASTVSSEIRSSAADMAE
jgi:hypothetical protein